MTLGLHPHLGDHVRQRLVQIEPRADEREVAVSVLARRGAARRETIHRRGGGSCPRRWARIAPDALEVDVASVNEATSRSRAPRIASIDSSIRRPRFVNSIPTAAYSSGSSPTPMPRSRRPPASASSVAALLASTAGWCSGTITTFVPRLIVARVARHEREPDQRVGDPAALPEAVHLPVGRPAVGRDLLTDRDDDVLGAPERLEPRRLGRLRHRDRALRLRKRGARKDDAPLHTSTPPPRSGRDGQPEEVVGVLAHDPTGRGARRGSGTRRGSRDSRAASASPSGCG